ncbi:MAG TPA: hotdog fold domain-containing protein [Candidatus Limnocylindrales bacterium]|nr:hotdog fold domain-containing protein [Candidatus Limnocylindrales bacterium]
MEKAMLRVRISEKDVHYGGGLVDGALCIKFFGDVATELLIRHDGDEGLFVAYDMIEFKQPVYAGDYLEITGWIDKVGATSRHMQFEAYKVISRAEIKECPSACNVHSKPLLVVRASGTCVVPKALQRGPQ